MQLSGSCRGSADATLQRLRAAAALTRNRCNAGTSRMLASGALPRGRRALHHQVLKRLRAALQGLSDHVGGREVRSQKAPIRHRRERPRRPAADIVSFARAGPYSGEPQDCSDDCDAAQCARLMHHPLPSRFRRLPVERPACVPQSLGDFDASRPDTANHPGPLTPRPAGCAQTTRVRSPSPKPRGGWSNFATAGSTRPNGWSGRANCCRDTQNSRSPATRGRQRNSKSAL